MLYKAGGLLIRNRKVLLNRQGGSDTFIVPGGQIKSGENYLQALIRELFEEFHIYVIEDNLEKLGIFNSPAVHNPGSVVNIHLFLVKKWTGAIQIQNEIEGIAWVNSVKLRKLTVSPFVTEIAFPLLLRKNLID